MFPQERSSLRIQTKLLEVEISSEGIDVRVVQVNRLKVLIVYWCIENFSATIRYGRLINANVVEKSLARKVIRKYPQKYVVRKCKNTLINAQENVITSIGEIDFYFCIDVIYFTVCQIVRDNVAFKTDLFYRNRFYK